MWLQVRSAQDQGNCRKGNMRNQSFSHGNLGQAAHGPVGHLQSYSRWLAAGQLLNRHPLQCRQHAWPTRTRRIINRLQASRFIAATQIPDAHASHTDALTQFIDQRLGIFHCQQDLPSSSNAECVNDLRQPVLEFSVDILCTDWILISFLSGKLWKSGQKIAAHFSTATTTAATALPASTQAWAD